MCLWNKDILYCGLENGEIHMYDISNTQLKLIKSYKYNNYEIEYLTKYKIDNTEYLFVVYSTNQLAILSC